MNIKDVQDNAEVSKIGDEDQLRSPLVVLRDLFAVDLRSLAFFRIGFAIILILDVLYRWRDISFFYTDEGSFSRIEAIRNMGVYSLCYHLMGGVWQFQAVTFLFALIAHICLLLGYRTRWAAFFSWLHLISIHRRNYQILQGGDDLIRNLAFWMMFLPIASRWSIDAARSAVKDKRVQVVSVASVGILMQMFIVYFFTALLKTGDQWRVDGTAIQYALEIDQFTKPFGYFLLHFPNLLRFMTLGVWYLEQYGPFIAFIPLRNAFFRTITVLLFVGFHFGLMLSMELGPFPWTCMIGWCVYLPTAFWDKIFPGSQRAAGSSLLPSPAKTSALRAGLFVREFALTFLFVNMVAWNIRGLNFKKWEKYYPTDYNFICQFFGLDQYWAMFSPFPLTIDGWYVIVGQTTKRTINLSPGAEPDDPITDKKPEWVADTYRTERWRKYLMNMMFVDNKGWRPGFVTALARQWNYHHPDETIKLIDVYYWIEDTNLNGPPQPRKEHLWHYDVNLP